MPLRNEPNSHLDIKAHVLSRIWNINKITLPVNTERVFYLEKRERNRESFLTRKAFQQKDHIILETISSFQFFRVQITTYISIHEIWSPNEEAKQIYNKYTHTHTNPTEWKRTSRALSFTHCT